MGAIFSKICLPCCGRSKSSKNAHSKQSTSKLSNNFSLIVQRSQCFKDVDEASEYSRVLERDFEICGKRTLIGNQRSQFGTLAAEDDDSISDSFKSAYAASFNDLKKMFELRHKESGKLFILTRIKKEHLTPQAADLIFKEVNLLAHHLPHHPFLVNLYWTWQDSKYLYRVDDGFEDQLDSIKENFANFASWDDLVLKAAQLATIIHYIHSYGLIHGNINPQSVTVSRDSLKLGSFKYLRKVEGGRRLSGVCGDYSGFRAPACSRQEGYFEEIDWYSFGKVLQFWVDQSLSSKSSTMSNETHHQFTDLIQKLACLDENSRLGYGPAGFKSIQSHSFFGNFNWTPLLNLSTHLDFKNSFTSLSQSIGSLKERSASQGDEENWEKFLEFNWDEGGEIGRTLESIIRR